MVAQCVSPCSQTSLQESASISDENPCNSDKGKHRQQAALLDAWLALNGENLYPCRKEKELLAKRVSMTYMQVNRWFANRRRRQTKRSKPDVLSDAHCCQPTDAFASEECQKSAVISGVSGTQNNSESSMVIHAGLPESVNSNGLLQAEMRQDTSSPSALAAFQQASDTYRPLMSPALTVVGQQISQLSGESKSLPTPPAYASIPQLNPAFCNASATNALLAAANATNPFLVAALLGLQQSAAPLPPNVQAFAALLPYLQQIQSHSQNELVMQQLMAAQQIAAVQQLAAASQNVVQQQPPQHWLSPPPSAASVCENASSPILSTSDESLSVLSESSHVSPRPRGDVISPDREGSLMFSEDDYLIESLIEGRKGLSEKESIAVAVLAGMAGCYQR